MCASMRAFLLASGHKRIALKNCTIMIHQPLGGYQGQATDIDIHAKQIIKTKEMLTKYLSEYTKGRVDLDTMYTLCERDNYLTAEQALEYGLIDEIAKSRKEI